VSRAMRTLLISGLLLAACGGDGDGFATPARCNPLGGTSCVTPWPSAIYEVDDASTATGRRVDIPAGALPTNIDDIAIDPAPWNELDGFSSAAPMVTAFPTGVDPTNLVPASNIAASLDPACPTVLIDMSNNTLVPHFAELDAAAAATTDHQALYIRPAAMLKGGTRYAVAIKRTLKAADGGELPIPEGYQAILDGTKSSHARLEAVRPRYDDVFASLAANGIDRADLVVAWDFTTASRESVRSDLLHGRDSALALMGTDGSALAFSVTSDAPTGDPAIARRIEGTYDAPLLLTNNGSVFDMTTRLVRDADGHPMATGLYRAPFTAIVPQCAIDSATPVPMIIYGHGLFGSSGQVGSSGPSHVAVSECAVVVGTDLRGMSDIDVPNIALALNDANLGSLIFEVLVQGMINHTALVQIARGPMASSLFTKAGGATLVDPSRFYYYGISQGGIMGTTICAIDPQIQKCVLGVGAVNYSLLLERSADWPTYRTTLSGAYPDPLDDILVINLMQNRWDRTEGTSVADVVLGEGFPATPKKQILMQIGIADVEVSNLGSEYQARTMGIPVLLPSPYVPFGVQGSSTPVASGIAIFDFGLGATIPRTNEPPPENEVHGTVRNMQKTVDMIKRFYDTGEIVQLCTAPKGCDCPAGGCGTEL